MARTWAELRRLSKDELIREYDKQALSTSTESVAFIRDVIFQRDLADQGDRMELMTQRIQTLTWWIMGLTVVNTLGVVATLVLELLR